jgi:hypothetical protein
MREFGRVAEQQGKKGEYDGEVRYTFWEGNNTCLF